MSNEGLIPLKDADGNVIGAIGVAGGAVPQDEQIAKAGTGSIGEIKFNAAGFLLADRHFKKGIGEIVLQYFFESYFT